MAMEGTGLKTVRDELDSIDRKMLQLLQQRDSLVREVAKIKGGSRASIQAAHREASMLARLEIASKELNLDADFVKELWSLIIWHAKQSQRDFLGLKTFLPTEPIPADTLRRNLRELAGHQAKSWDRQYVVAASSDAIGAYLAREAKYLRQVLRKLPDKELALDLGCATGQVTERIHEDFDQVRAFDVSLEMIEEANRRKSDWGVSVSFENEDLEKGIPAKDGRASLVVAGMGTASELGRNIVREVARVLKPGGRALLSFYNKDALLTHWFYPWPTTVRARLNDYNDTLEVWTADNVYTVRAYGRTVREVRQEMDAAGLHLDYVETYPTLLAIAPRIFFQRPELHEFIDAAGQIDEHLASSDCLVSRGTYLLALVKKGRD